MKKLAILVLNYNGERFLNKCFKSLLTQTSNDFDIYLIDNNSTDSSREYTKSNFLQVKIINTNGNLWFTGAYNYVTKYFDDNNIDYDYYLFLNNDTESDGSLVERIIRIFRAYDKVGIVQPTIVDLDMNIIIGGGRFLFLTGTSLGYRPTKKYARGNDIYKCFWASGCALAIRKELFNKLGYFNDYSAYYEDHDLSWRVNNDDHDVVATNATYVKHFEGGTKAFLPKQHYLCERNRIICYWQNLPNILFFSVLPSLLFFRIILLFRNIKPIGNICGKLRGIIAGLTQFYKFKKKTYELSRHLKVIRSMNKIYKY